MTFISIAQAANGLRTICDLSANFVPAFIVAIYAILSGALALTWRCNSSPTVFIGFAGFLAVLYLFFVFGTIPQMDSEKWIHNYEEEDASSFGMQFISSLGFTMVFTHGISAAFLLCDKTPEV
jgi:hypothetical protein